MINIRYIKNILKLKTFFDSVSIQYKFYIKVCTSYLHYSTLKH